MVLRFGDIEMRDSKSVLVGVSCRSSPAFMTSSSTLLDTPAVSSRSESCWTKSGENPTSAKRCWRAAPASHASCSEVQR